MPSGKSGPKAQTFDRALHGNFERADLSDA
jgi:hypothetical protein